MKKYPINNLRLMASDLYHYEIKEKKYDIECVDVIEDALKAVFNHAYEKGYIAALDENGISN